MLRRNAAEKIGEGELVKEKRKFAAIVVILIAVLVMTLLLKPKYDTFIAQDNRETCYDGRYWIGIWYHMAIREEKAAGKRDSEIDYEGLLRDVIAVHYQATVNDNLELDDFCRAGGHIQMKLDPDTHRLSMLCDIPSHPDYTDEMATEEFLDGLQGVTSGLSRKQK